MIRSALAAAALAAAASCGPSGVSGSAEPRGSHDLGAGRVLAAERCGTCHAVGRGTTVSPHAKAPPFVDVVKLYPPEQLSEALSEGIMVGHEDMPEFRFTDMEIDRLIIYLKSLE